jgi:hypothetical protein
MTYLGKDNDMDDPGFCRAKEVEYAAKARAATDKALKSAYEAAAREYSYRLILIGSKKAAFL